MAGGGRGRDSDTAARLPLAPAGPRTAARSRAAIEAQDMNEENKEETKLLLYTVHGKSISWLRGCGTFGERRVA